MNNVFFFFKLHDWFKHLSNISKLRFGKYVEFARVPRYHGEVLLPTELLCLVYDIYNTKFTCIYIYMSVCNKYNFQAQRQIYLGRHFLANTTTNIFRLKFFGRYEQEYIWIPFSDKYEHKYIWVYQKWANMNTNTIIWTDICKYEYYKTQNLK